MAVSNGSSDAFSTGSQNQNPPHPSSSYAQRMPKMTPFARKNHDRQDPTPGNDNPPGVELAAQKRGDGERERHRERRESQVQGGRMDGHPVVLQLGIQPSAVRRCEREPLERIHIAEQQDHQEEARYGEEDPHHVRHELPVLVAVREDGDGGEEREENGPRIPVIPSDPPTVRTP